MTRNARKAQGANLVLDPAYGKTRRFPMSTEASLYRNACRVLNLKSGRLAVFVRQHDKPCAGMVLPNPFLRRRMIDLKRENQTGSALEHLRLVLDHAFSWPEWDGHTLTSTDVFARNPPETIDSTPPADDLLPLGGYDSWLDYAVGTFDIRSVEMEWLFVMGEMLDRQAVRLTASNELAFLRLRANAAPMPKVPIGEIKSLRRTGPKYAVGRPLRALSNGEWMIEIIMEGSGEVTERRLSQVLSDPDAR